MHPQYKFYHLALLRVYSQFETIILTYSDRSSFIAVADALNHIACVVLTGSIIRQRQSGWLGPDLVNVPTQ